MIDIEKAIGLAVEKSGKQDALAHALTLDPGSLSRSINGQRGWTAIELNKIIELAGCEIVIKGKCEEEITALKDKANSYKEALRITLCDGI